MREDEKHKVKALVAKFEAIPDDKWCTHAMIDRQGRRCAMGHAYSMAGAAAVIVRAVMSIDTLPSIVNDGKDYRYQQATPKARIIAALSDAIRV